LPSQELTRRAGPALWRSDGLRGLKRLARSALTRAPATSTAARVVVLCYHSIHPRNSFLSATPELFDDHIAWLKENCDIVAFRDVFQISRTPPSEKTTVAITFDDGYEDNHTQALPVLARHGVPATFFVTTAFADGDPGAAETMRALVDARPEEVSSMSWTQIGELVAGGMEVGSHTVNHPNLAVLSDARALHEMVDSKSYIEDKLQQEVLSIAYPFGLPRRSFSRTTIDLAGRAGYAWGAAILYRNVRRSDGPLTIPRIAVTNDSQEMLRRKIAGGFDWLGLYQERAPTWALRALSGNGPAPPGPDA
jgi:peptidoglycan/xylan/chitin deacetylase (PgdA/CDA1 family)